MNKSFVRELLLWLIKVCGITFFVLACVVPFSCRLTEEGIVLICDAGKGPCIDSFYVTGEDSARIVFEGPVKLKEASLTPKVEISESRIQLSEDVNGMCCVDFSFGEKLEAGETYRFYGEVQDKAGNTLTFSLPFTGFNGRLPEVEITEVHPKYGSSTTKALGTVYKCEYVELRVVKDGNMAGLELYSAYDGEEKAYAFKPMEVKAGEVIVVHLRRKEGMGAADETGDSICVSRSFYSSDSARDLWVETDSARLGDEMDVLLVRNVVDGSVLDAVCYASGGAEDWKTDAMKDAVLKAVEYGKWNSVLVQDAAVSDGITVTKSLEKTAAGSQKQSWTVTATSGTNPGIINF